MGAYNLSGLLVLFVGDMRLWESTAVWYKRHFCDHGARISAITHQRITEKGGHHRIFDTQAFFSTYGSCVDQIILQSRHSPDMMEYEDQLRERLAKENYTYHIRDRRNWVHKKLMAEASKHNRFFEYERIFVGRSDITVHYHDNDSGKKQTLIPHKGLQTLKFHEKCRPPRGPEKLLNETLFEWCLSDFLCVLKPSTLRKIPLLFQSYGENPMHIDGTSKQFYSKVVQMEGQFARWRKLVKLPDIRDNFSLYTFSAIALVNRKFLTAQCECKHYISPKEEEKACSFEPVRI